MTTSQTIKPKHREAIVQSLRAGVVPRAIAPPEGVVREGDVYYRMLGRTGLYNAEIVRAEMGAPFAAVKVPARDAKEPAFEFVEL